MLETASDSPEPGVRGLFPQLSNEVIDSVLVSQSGESFTEAHLEELNFSCDFLRPPSPDLEAVSERRDSDVRQLLKIWLSMGKEKAQQLRDKLAQLGEVTRNQLNVFKYKVKGNNTKPGAYAELSSNFILGTTDELNLSEIDLYEDEDSQGNNTKRENERNDFVMF